MAHVCNYTATEIGELPFTEFLGLWVTAEEWMKVEAENRSKMVQAIIKTIAARPM